MGSLLFFKGFNCSWFVFPSLGLECVVIQFTHGLNAEVTFLWINHAWGKSTYYIPHANEPKMMQSHESDLLIKSVYASNV